MGVLTERQADLCRLVHGDGLKVTEAGQRLGLSRFAATVEIRDAYRALRQATRRPPGSLTVGQRRRQARDARIVLAADQGLSQRRIAQRFHLARATVQDILAAGQVEP